MVLEWTPNFKIHIPKLKDMAMVEEVANNSDIKVYVDGSYFKGGVGVAAVLYRNGKKKEVIRAYLLICLVTLFKSQHLDRHGEYKHHHVLSCQ